MGAGYLWGLLGLGCGTHDCSLRNSHQDWEPGLSLANSLESRCPNVQDGRRDTPTSRRTDRRPDRVPLPLLAERPGAGTPGQAGCRRPAGRRRGSRSPACPPAPALPPDPTTADRVAAAPRVRAPVSVQAGAALLWKPRDAQMLSHVSGGTVPEPCPGGPERVLPCSPPSRAAAPLARHPCRHRSALPRPRPLPRSPTPLLVLPSPNGRPERMLSSFCVPLVRLTRCP